MSNDGPNIFVTTIIQEIEDREKKSTWHATRWKRAPTTRSHICIMGPFAAYFDSMGPS
jgi:hypothetical protein